MLNLQDLKSKLATAPVVLMGREVTARALTAAEGRIITAAIPRPEPKSRTENLNGGSLAVKVPDEYEPGFQALLNEWYAKTGAAVVAVAVDLEVPGTGTFAAAADKAAWVVKAAEELMAVVPDAQIKAANIKIRGLLDPSAVMSEIIREVPRTAETAPRQFELPARYCRGDAGAFLDSCEVFGIDPFAALGADYGDPLVWALIESWMVVRKSERAEEEGG